MSGKFFLFNVPILGYNEASYNTFPSFFPLFLVTVSMLKTKFPCSIPFRHFCFRDDYAQKNGNQNEKLSCIPRKVKIKIIKIDT